jgi:PAS domain S-box-containing protein
VEEENQSLRTKIATLEQALIQSPIYKFFFEYSRFPCNIIESQSGKIIDANIAFKKEFGYNDDDLSKMTIFDFSLEPDKTKRSIEEEVNHVTTRLVKRKSGESTAVEISMVQYEKDGMKYAFGMFFPKIEISISSRIEDILQSVLTSFSSEYATLWVLHNGGSNKISGMYEATKPGNRYLVQDYRGIPAKIFEKTLNTVHKNGHALISVKQEDEYPGIVGSLKFSGLGSILLCPIVDKDNTLIGMISTSWREDDIELCDETIAILLKFAKSDILKEATLKERNNH